MINITIDPRYRDQVTSSVLIHAAEQTLSLVGDADKVELSIAISDDAQLQQLNKQFRDTDEVTDVLSFPVDSPTAATPNEGKVPQPEEGYLGDVAISMQRAIEQAEAGGHAVEQELELLTVHSVLHLLGHDHYEQQEKETMWRLQQQVLESLANPLRPE